MQDLTSAFLALLKKTNKVGLKAFNEQLKAIPVLFVDKNLQEVLKVFGKSLGHILLLNKFQKIHTKAQALNKKLKIGCDFLVMQDLPEGAIKSWPVAGYQAYIRTNKGLFFVDKGRLQVSQIQLSALQLAKLDTAFNIEFSRKGRAFWDMKRLSIREKIPMVLSKAQLAELQGIIHHERPPELIKGLPKPFFVFLNTSNLFLKTVNVTLKVCLLIAAVASFESLVAPAVVQYFSALFFLLSFAFTSISLSKAVVAYQNECNENKYTTLRLKVFQQLLEFMLPLSILVVTGLSSFGLIPSALSAYATISLLALPFYRAIFKEIRNLTAFQKADSKDTRNALSQFLKLITGGIGLASSGYGFAKDLVGVTMQVGPHVIDLGAFIMSSASTIFSVFTVTCCVIGLGQNIFSLIQARRELSNSVEPSVPAEIQERIVGSTMNSLLCISTCSLALIGFVGALNPVVEIGLITALVSSNFTASKFFPTLRLRLTSLFFDLENTHSHSEVHREADEIPNISPPVKFRLRKPIEYHSAFFSLPARYEPYCSDVANVEVVEPSGQSFGGGPA